MQEFSSFMALKTDTKVIVDRSPMNDLLRINFNMTFTKMTCEHLTLDVSDSLGSVRPAAVRLQVECTSDALCAHCDCTVEVSNQLWLRAMRTATAHLCVPSEHRRTRCCRCQLHDSTFLSKWRVCRKR